MVNIAYELSKIKDSFTRVRDDMNFLKSAISTNYEEIKHKHKQLSHTVEHLSNQLKDNLSSAKHHISEAVVSSKDIFDIHLEIKELKKHILDIEQTHNDFSKKIMDKSSTSDQMRDIKNSVESSALDIHLLKERMLEKDLEIKQLQTVNQKLFEIVDELAKTEMQIIRRQ